MDGREGPEVVVWREVRDLYRVDVVVGTGRRAGVMGGSGVAGCEVGPHSELELAVTLEKVGGGRSGQIRPMSRDMLLP